jgi:hypothetical protein
MNKFTTALEGAASMALRTSPPPKSERSHWRHALVEARHPVQNAARFQEGWKALEDDETPDEVGQELLRRVKAMAMATATTA